MLVNYSLSVLGNQKKVLQDKLTELNDERYDKFTFKNIEKARTDIQLKIADLDSAIELLEQD